MRKEVEPLEDHADLFAHLVDICLARERDAVNDDLASRRFLEMVHAAQQRALARARGADDNDNLFFINGEIDPLQHLIRAKRLTQPLNLNHGRDTSVPDTRQSARWSMSSRDR